MQNELFSLGDVYVSDFVSDKDLDTGNISEKSPLTLIMDTELGAPRLIDVPDADKMYGKYWYRSGINATMTNELKNIAEECIKSIPTKPGDIFMDIACNDGTMFKFIPDTFTTVGVDPCDDSYYKESSQLADLIIQDYFSAEAYKKSKYGKEKAKIISIIAMFYDLDDPLTFLKDIDEVLDDEGLLLIQMSYTPLMLRQLAFDNICHEHVYYHTLNSMKTLLSKVGMSVVDCQLNDINGGSFRLYIRKDKANPTNFRTSPYRDVAKYRVESVEALEEKEKSKDPETYKKFFKEITELKEKTVKFIREEKSKGKTIWGYGASTKGNTLLQWFGLDASDIDGIAERSPYKYGLKTVGTGIPIYSEDKMREVQPDYLLVLPWHFIHEFKKREDTYLRQGGKFIVPCPSFEIIGHDDYPFIGQGAII
tara:strand:- start:1609 stop:2877 length:1269 start_codon:yes stop_codon:yes gene_type:complete